MINKMDKNTRYNHFSRFSKKLAIGMAVTIFAVVPAVAIAAIATGAVNVTVTDAVAQASSTAPVSIVLTITSDRNNGLVISNQPSQTPFRISGAPNQAVAVSLPQNSSISFGGKTIDLNIFANTGGGTPALNPQGQAEFNLQTAAGSNETNITQLEPLPQDANTVQDATTELETDATVENINDTASTDQSLSELNSIDAINQTLATNTSTGNTILAGTLPLIVSSPFINITISYN